MIAWTENQPEPPKESSVKRPGERPGCIELLARPVVKLGSIDSPVVWSLAAATFVASILAAPAVVVSFLFGGLVAAIAAELLR